MEGQAVTFNGFELPTFYIASQDYKGGVASITAYDLCKNLDIPFDYSDYTQFNEDGSAKRYSTSLIVSAAANQCGFSSGGYSGRTAQLCYNDFAGKTCRAILEDLSKADVGHWQDSGGVLAFVPFSAPSSGLAAPDSGSRTEIVRRGTKVITGIYALDEIYGTEYSTGSSWAHTERLSGRYLSEETVQQMTSQILGSGGKYDYHGWESTALTDYLYNIGDHIAYDGDLLPVLSADNSFTALGIVAALSAPAADGSFSEYHDLYSREIDGKLSLGKSYGCFFAGDKGFGLRIDI